MKRWAIGQLALALVGGGGLAAPGRAAPGDLDRRLELSRGRLSQPDYPDQADRANAIEPDWPGDVPGRLILALTSLAEATGKEPPQLRALVASVPAALNAQGYIGPVLDLAAINEQQLSGNAWLISGLCHYSAYSGDARPLAWVRTMIDHLALPLQGKYRQYPITPDDRNRAGGVDGRLTGRVVQGWRVSTDVGCAYIFLEGLVAAYRVMPSPALAHLIDEAGESFLAIDFRRLQPQTHASLCAARNLLAYDQLTGRRSHWLPQIESFYQLYRTEAMTENEANWNWFGRRSWTEPCAIVDSFLLSLELWRVTGQVDYLEDAHRIFYNGLGYGQKPTGGFGCDAFVGTAGLTIANRHWDVPWCCNMRGACGLDGATQARTEWRESARTLLLPFYSDGGFDIGGWKMTEQTGWPIAGEVEIRAHRDRAQSADLRHLALFIPAEADSSSVRLTLNGQEIPSEVRDGFVLVTPPSAGDAFTLRLHLEFPLRTEAPHNRATPKDLVTLRYGYLVLGTPDGQTLPELRLSDLQPLGRGRFRVGSTGLVLAPLAEMPFSASTKAAPWRTQVLFHVAAD